MADFKVEIRGLDELRRALKDYPRISEPILQRAIAGSQAVLAKNTLKDNPVPWKTGNLLESFRFATGKLQARWFPTARYAVFVHEGTKPHDIMPVNKRVLADRKMGIIYGMLVHHPGTKANRFMPKIIQKAQPEIDKLFIRALDLINAQIAKNTNLR